MQQLSIWEKETFFAPQDVIIIGSGFTGLWSALHTKLLHPDYKVTILERGLIPTGASTKNAGFSCFGSPSELLHDSALMGEEKMWNLVTLRYQGLQEIRRYFDEAVIDYNNSGGYECFSNDSVDWDLCAAQMDWLNKGLKRITGETDVFTIADRQLDDFGFKGFSHMIANKLEGSLHPAKLVKALLQRIQEMGVQVLTGVDVTSYVQGHQQVKIITSQGLEFTSRQLLICTNAFTPQLVSNIDIIPNRGQVLITAPIAELAFKGSFHFDRGFYYFRNVGNRLLLGGARNKAFEEENTLEMATSGIIQEELERFIQEHLLPGTAIEITDRWTGIMGMGSEKSPIVQALSEDVYCCVRMSGMGVALAPVIARQAIELMNR